MTLRETAATSGGDTPPTPAPKRKPAAEKTTPRKPTEKPPAKKTPARKATATKSAAKKTTTAKNAPARPTPPKRTAAKKPAAPEAPPTGENSPPQPVRRLRTRRASAKGGPGGTAPSSATQPEARPAPEAEARNADGVWGEAPAAQPAPLPARPAFEAEARSAETGARGQRPRSATQPPGPDPAAAFDDLYTRTAPTLTRQTYLLTGNHPRARAAVEHAFHTAWERWPEVAKDRDPEGWLRAAAYEHALSPWHHLRRIRPGAKRTAAIPTDGEANRTPEDKALLEALLDLPASYRRAVLLYDGVGLDLPETAAELEASTPAAAGRVTHAREALAEAVPELRKLDPDRQGELLHLRLRRLAEAQPVRILPPGAARHRSEKRTAALVKRTAALAVAIIVGVVITTLTAPDYDSFRTIERPPWDEPRTLLEPADPPAPQTQGA